MSEFQVEPEALRSSAVAIQPLPARMTEACAGPAEAATEAVAANPSYLTGAAIESFVATLESAISSLAETIAQHGGGLGNAAASYEHTDSRAAGSLDVHSRRLDSMRPGIDGLRRGPGTA